MIAVTGATGQLGRLVIAALLQTEAPDIIVALARDPGAAADLAARGVSVRRADYDAPETLAPALVGVTKLLLISSSEVGRRLPQHQAVIAAAEAAGVELLAYTSILHADTSAMMLAGEHKATEAALAASGLPHVLLRHGWYAENFASAIASGAEHGVMIGASGTGRISAAPRADYAAAAAAVLTAPTDQSGEVYELAGDAGFTMAELAAEVAGQSGRAVVYNDMPQADYAAALVGYGLDAGFAAVLADSDAQAARGALQDDSRSLSRLIGRPTTPMAETVRAQLKG